MESYTKWRKMLFDVLGGAVFCRLFDNGEAITSPDTIEVQQRLESNKQFRYGICSYNSDSFKKYNERTHMGFHASHIPSTTFRTADIYRDRDLKNKLLVVHSSTNDWYSKSFEDELIITTEGLMLIHGDKKKKFLFMDDGYDYKITFSTFHELAVLGYKISGDRLSLSPKVNKNYFNSVYVTDTLRAIAYDNYLREVLPKLVELVKENEDLYEDAIDEICEKYPQEKK